MKSKLVAEIGSVFPSPTDTLLSDPGTPPWEMPGFEINYVQSGRQALAILAALLGATGRSRLVLPGHFCDTMAEPFVREGWAVIPVRLTESLNVELEDLRSVVLADPEVTVVLSAPYFGSMLPSDESAALKQFLRQGVPVVADETHRVFTPGGPASFSIGSLRKLLPVADGAYIRSPRPLSLQARRDAWCAEQRWGQMDALANASTSSERQCIRAELARSEEALGSSLEPAIISERSLATLRRLDYGELARRRRENAATLRKALVDCGVRLVTEETEGVAGHIVVAADGARRIQERLASRGAFCPVHWGRSRLVPLDKWREDLLSIPVDHRYAADDMVALARVVAEEVHGE